MIEAPEFLKRIRKSSPWVVRPEDVAHGVRGCERLLRVALEVEENAGVTGRRELLGEREAERGFPDSTRPLQPDDREILCPDGVKDFAKLHVSAFEVPGRLRQLAR